MHLDQGCAGRPLSLISVGGAKMSQGGSDDLQNNDKPVRILVADDSEVVRRGIRQLLSNQSEIAIVGEAVSFAQVLQMASDLAPHMIVLDLHMPDEINVTPQELKSRLHPGSQVLATSVWNDEDTRELAESMGAAVFLDKIDLARTLIPTIMQLKRARGEAV